MYHRGCGLGDPVMLVRNVGNEGGGGMTDFSFVVGTVGGVAAFGGDFAELVFREVGEVSGVGVGHCDGWGLVGIGVKVGI